MWHGGLGTALRYSPLPRAGRCVAASRRKHCEVIHTCFRREKAALAPSPRTTKYSLTSPSLS